MTNVNSTGLSVGDFQKIKKMEEEQQKQIAQVKDSAPTVSVVPASSDGGKTTTAEQKPDTKKNADEAAQKEVAAPKQTVTEKTTKQKADEAQAAYDDYVNSAEHKAAQLEAAKKSMLERQQQFQAGADPSAAPVEAYDERERALKAEADYWKAKAEEEADQGVMVTDLEELSTWSAEDQQALALYVTNRNRDANAPLELTSNPFYKTAEAEAAGLIQKYGKQKVDELAESYLRSQNQQTAQKVTEAAQEGAGGSVGGGFVHSVASVGANLMNGLTGVLGYMQELGRSTGRYKTLDPNNAGNLLGTYSGAVRQEVAQNIEGENGSNGVPGQIGSIVYQGFMSALDSGARAVTGSVGNALLSATGSFTQTVSEASRQGATPGQALALGATNAAVEALSEKIPLDNLLNVAKGGKQTAKEAVKNALKQAGIEASTEEISLIGTTLAEAAILKEKSGYNQQIQEAVANGMSYAEAKKQADSDLLKEAANTAAVSAFSGGIMSGAESALLGIDNNAKTSQEPQTEQPGREAVQPEANPAQPQNAAPAAVETAADVLGNIVGKFKETGAISNKMAESILADPAAVRQLQEKTGMEITGTKSQMRDAVKVAVRQAAGGDVAMTKEGAAILMEDSLDGIGQQPEAETRQTETKQSSAPQVDITKQSTEGGQLPNAKGTGAAERNFSGKAAYQDLLYEGNVQRDRPTDVRPMEVPKTDGYGRNVTEFAANAYGAEVTSDRMAGEIESLIQDGALGFDRRSNKESLNAAYDAIYGKEGKKGRGEAGTLNNIRKNIYDGKIKDGDIEKALLLYAKHAGKKGKRSQEYAAELMVDLSTMANMAGRNLQLFKLLRRMTPQGQLMAVEKNVQRYVDDLNKGRSSRKQADVEIPQDLEKAFLTATTDEERSVASDAIYKNAAAQIKPTLGEMWDAWRNLAMLGNPKTHIRNIGGSAAFRPYVSVKRTIAAGIERLTLDQKNRTKAVLGVSKESQELLKWAKGDSKSQAAKDAMDFSGTTGNEVRNEIEDARQILPGKLDTVRKKNMELMEGADMFFKQREYAYSLASFLKAKGYNAEDIQTGKVPDSVLTQGREMAVKEAQKATFNDRNKFSDTISKFRVKGNEGWSKALNAMAKGIMPYTRTPANIVVRAKEYSPVEIARGLDTLVRKVKSGEATVSDGIDQLASGLTGSGALVLGSALAAGLIPGVRLVGKIDDEDELREGAQEYSLKVGDSYYGISWLAPANIPLFIGANLYNSITAKEETGEMDGWDYVSGLVETFTDIIDPMLELSCLSSLADAVENASYEDSAGDMFLSIAASAATSYFTQGLPTIFGQAEQATETTKSNVYSNADNTVQRAFERTVGNATKRIPGVDLYQTDKLDEFGNVVENEGNLAQRAFDAFLNPFTKTKEKNDALTKEISRLNDAQPEKVSPPDIPKTISYTDSDGESHSNQRLTEEEYNTLATVQGQTAKSILEKMFRTENYQDMTDAQKAKAVQMVYDYAQEKGRIAAIKNYSGYSDSWMMNIDGKEAQIINERVVSSSIENAVSGLNTAWEQGYDPKQYSEELEKAFDSYKKMDGWMQENIMEAATGTTAKYLEARDSGITHRQFVYAAEKIENVAGTGAVDKETGEAKVRDIDERQALAESGLNDKTIDTLMKVYMPDYDPAEPTKNTTELKYDYIRQELGLSPAEYAETYRAHLDNSKKADKIAAIVALGYSEKIATTLYYIYQGTSSKVDVVKWYNSK